jgi:hypothetical protein
VTSSHSSASLIVLLLAATACTDQKKPAAAVAATSATQFSVREEITSAPTVGDSAVRLFVPDVAFTDVDGECRRVPRPSTRTATYSARFPGGQRTSQSTVTIIVDSSGHLVRYAEMRGSMRILGSVPGAPAPQRDSLVRAAQAEIRHTFITLDYPTDEVTLRNTGGGRPAQSVLGTIPAAESLKSIGSIASRVKLVKRLCGLEK